MLPEGVVYLDGNSLGALPLSTPHRLRHVIEAEWGRDLIGSWNSADWMALPERVGRRIARLIGAGEDEVIAAESTSVALFKLVTAALALRPDRSDILTDDGNFPSDLYVLEGVAAQTGRRLILAPKGEIAARIGPQTALLCLTHVDYRTGRLHDLAGLTAAAHQAGALALWDLSHSAGALELNLTSAAVDLAVGCGYKYFNGGPGAPGFMMARRALQNELRQPIQGWIGHAAPFDFSLTYAPADGLTRLQSGTPHVLGLSALEEGLKTFDDIDMALVAAKSRALGDYFLTQVEARLPGVFEVVSPRDAAVRGSQVGLSHPHAYAIVQALIAAGVVGDFRAPDVARFGFTPLYLSFADVETAVDRLDRIMRETTYLDPAYQVRRAVT